MLPHQLVKLEADNEALRMSGQEAEGLRLKLEADLSAQQAEAEAERMALLDELHAAQGLLAAQAQAAKAAAAAAEAEIQALSAALLEKLEDVAMLERAASVPPSPGIVQKAQALEAAEAMVRSWRGGDRSINPSQGRPLTLPEKSLTKPGASAGAGAGTGGEGGPGAR